MAVASEAFAGSSLVLKFLTSSEYFSEELETVKKENTSPARPVVRLVVSRGWHIEGRWYGRLVSRALWLQINQPSAQPVFRGRDVSFWELKGSLLSGRGTWGVAWLRAEVLRPHCVKLQVFIIQMPTPCMDIWFFMGVV